MPIKRKHAKTPGLIFIISGPSGSGKTTVLEKIVNKDRFSANLARSVSFTTRPKRSKEEEGKDYFFISERQFKAKLKAKKILESTVYLGYYYGTPRGFLEKRIRLGLDTILCLDAKGAFRLKRLYPENTVTIFLLPPSLGDLAKRIEKRCNKTRQDEIERRLKLSKAELRLADKYDYRLMNKDLNKAIAQLEGIILGSHLT